jgi:hypothetical protein
MRKDHATAAPVAGGVRLGAWRRRAHAQLLRQRQGNAPLLQVGLATAPRQGGLEGSELLGQIGPGWAGLMPRWCGWCWRPGCRRLVAPPTWCALPAGGEHWESRQALLLLTPLRTCLLQVTPRAAGKADKAAAVHLHAQAALAIGAVKE